MSAAEIDRVLEGLGGVFGMGERALLAKASEVYAARNLTEVWPGAGEWAFHPRLRPILRGVLGEGYGLVRAIYFDKNPATPWGLPWHQDVTIAVKEHRAGSGRMKNPTVKRGVPHVEAPEELLARMITVRLHLDDADAANGALEVIPGSHAGGKCGAPGAGTRGELIACRAGDAMLMRPLLFHRSAKPAADSSRHRRVLHFEYAPAGGPGEGFEWWEFAGEGG